MYLLAAAVVVVLLILLQGALLQVSCAVVGERPPAYGHALSTALSAAFLSILGTAAFGCTAGVVISLFSRWLAGVCSAVLGVTLTASVYRNRLEIGQGTAFAVALVHHGLAWLLSGAVWWLVHLLR